MSSDQAPPRGGSQLQVSRYRIVKHIASGGMGAVYLAYDPLLNRDVALKVLSPEMAARPNMVERFHREAKAAAKLRHENIVSIFDFGEASGTFFLALEYVEGTDLEDYIEQRPGGRLDIEDAVDIAIQAAKALDHAAAQGIVHRDIKPSNFLVTKRGGQLFVKLTDMGLAREADDSRITRDNTTLGTVDYISPEQARDSGSADTRSDLYSLGCTIFHMLVGHGPFPKGNLIEKVQQHLSSPPPDVRFHRGDVPDHLSDVLFKLLAKDPYERYQTPLELIHDLMNPADFKEYLEATHELDRPTFTPPQHHARTINATVMLPIEDLLPPPDPLFPSSVDLPTTDTTAASTTAASTTAASTTAASTTAASTTAVAAALEHAELSRGDTVITRSEVAAEAQKSPSSTAIRQPKAGDSVEEVELEELEEELEEDEEDVRLNAAFEAAFAAAAAEQKLAPPAKANGSHTLTRKPGAPKSTQPARPKTASPEAQARLKRMEKSIKKRETTRWIAIAAGGLLLAALLVWMIAGRNSGGDNEDTDDGSPEVQPKRVLPKQPDKGKSVRPKSP